MTKRNLYAELEEGLDALADERAGKITLPTHAVDHPPTRDRAKLDEWLHDQVVPAYDAIKAAPSRAVSVDEVRNGIAAPHEVARKK